MNRGELPTLPLLITWVLLVTVAGLGVCLPTVALVSWLVAGLSHGVTFAPVLVPAVETILFAGIGALCVIAAGVTPSLLSTRSTPRRGAVIENIVYLTSSIPGILIAVGILQLIIGLKRMAPLGMYLEIELGVTGGEEDGVDNTDIDAAHLYTQPEEVAFAYEQLGAVSSQFTVAAAFGNVHGVYKPGNVELTPVILKNSQEHIAAKHGTGSRPVNFVFHGGSGSSVEEIREAISYGAVKMNIDTDMQWAFLSGVRDYTSEWSPYLQSQIGNPEGPDQPNKKKYDPRVWLRQGEQYFVQRLTQAFDDLNCMGRNRA